MTLVYRINTIRWRMARRIAPDPIVAKPMGDAKVFIFMEFEDGMSAWVAAKTLDLSFTNTLTPLDWEPAHDEFGRVTLDMPKNERFGTFSGAI